MMLRTSQSKVFLQPIKSIFFTSSGMVFSVGGDVRGLFTQHTLAGATSNTSPGDALCLFDRKDVFHMMAGMSSIFYMADKEMGKWSSTVNKCSPVSWSATYFLVVSNKL